MNSSEILSMVRHILNKKEIDMLSAHIDTLEAQVNQLAAERDAVVAENVGLKGFGDKLYSMYKGLETSGGGFHDEQSITYQQAALDAAMSEFDGIKTPATDAYAASLRAEARKQGAVFAANRMLAAWDAGFVEDTPENAADIARAILMSTEFMDEASDGDFDRSFADEVLEAIAAQLRSKSEVQS